MKESNCILLDKCFSALRRIKCTESAGVDHKKLWNYNYMLPPLGHFQKGSCGWHFSCGLVIHLTILFSCLFWCRSGHVLPCRPSGITVDIKKSSYKKLSKWLQAKASAGLVRLVNFEISFNTFLLEAGLVQVKWCVFIIWSKWCVFVSMTSKYLFRPSGTESCNCQL